MKIYNSNTTDQEFAVLEAAGHSGTINDKRFSFLRKRGYQNSLTDMMSSWVSFLRTQYGLPFSNLGFWMDATDILFALQENAVSRPTVGTVTMGDGSIMSVPQDTLRYDFLGAGGVLNPTERWLLVEGGGTNYVRRSSHTAAYPWNTATTNRGITATLVGTGFVGDVPYADYALTGTNTAIFTDPFADVAQSRTAAVSGQTWTGSLYAKLISGTWPAGRAINVSVVEETAANVFLDSSNSVLTPTSVDQRTTVKRTLTNASTGNVRSAITIDGLGAAGNTTFTGQVIRLYGWQLEQSPVATSLIQTLGGAAVARSQDAIAPIDLTGIYSYGPELVTNGDFSNGLTGWTLIGTGNTSVVVDGVAQVSGASNPGLRRSGILTVGKSYLISCRVRRTAGTGASFVTHGAVAPQLTSNWQTFTTIGVATTDRAEFGILGDATGTVVEYDNISVREITTPSLGVAFDGYLDGVVGTFDRLVQLDSGSDTGARLLVVYDRALSSVSVEIYNAANVYQGGAKFAVALPSRVKLAIRYSANMIQAVCNGTASAIDTSADFVAPQYARLGSTVSGLARPARIGVGQLLIGPAMTEAEAMILGSL